MSDKPAEIYIYFRFKDDGTAYRKVFEVDYEDIAKLAEHIDSMGLKEVEELFGHSGEAVEA